MLLAILATKLMLLITTLALNWIGMDWKGGEMEWIKVK